MAIVQLVRKKVTMPDGGLNLNVVWEDQGNPLIDEAGNPILTSEPGPDGLAIPAYPEFCEVVQLPENIIADRETLEALIAPSKALALARAQERAGRQEVKIALLPILEVLNTDY